MTELDELPQLPGYVSVREAAEILKLAEVTVYSHIRRGNLEAVRVGGGVAVKQESIDNFKRTPPGRQHKGPPGWRQYTMRNTIYATEIQVRAKPGRERRLQEKLEAIRKSNKHTLTGSIARYVTVDREDAGLVRIWLVWKDTELPEGERHEQEMAAFKSELADVLDWGTAQVSENDGLIYT